MYIGCFQQSIQYTCARGKKYSSKLDIFCSLIRIFAKYGRKAEEKAN